MLFQYENLFMKKLAKFLIIFCAIILFVGIGGCMFFSKKLPDGVKSERTVEIIDKMNSALNKAAWDSTRYVKWTFMGGHHYLWDKEANLAQVEWKQNKVLLDPDEVKGVAYAQNVKQEGDQAEKLIQKAWSFWCNDMFWMTAPFKVNDPGVRHELVQDESGDRLKVIYSSGGVTPGDIYIWSFDEEGRPSSYDMFVKILPIKGVSVPWGGWIELPTGALLSTKHEMKGMGMTIENVKGGMNLSDVDLTNDIWAEIR